MSKQVRILRMCLCALKTKHRGRTEFLKWIDFSSSLLHPPLTFHRHCTVRSQYTRWWKPGWPRDPWTLSDARLSLSLAVTAVHCRILSCLNLSSAVPRSPLLCISISLKCNLLLSASPFSLTFILFLSDSFCFAQTFLPSCSSPPSFASSRSVPCPLLSALCSPVFGSAVGSEDDNTKAPKTVLKSQSVNLYRKHTSSFYNTGSLSLSRTHTWPTILGFDKECWRGFHLGFYEKIRLWYILASGILSKIHFWEECILEPFLIR